MMRTYARGFKRLLDLAIVLVGWAGFWVPMAWIAWRLRQEVGSPVLFRQTRVGFARKMFTVLKFRTMAPDGAVPGSFCRALRATAMDELPQMFNILRGEMSFVGPRPLIPEELETLERLPRGADRLSVRPGLTGLAQINSDKAPTLAERLRWDLLYVDRCSLRLDLSLLFQSVGITLRSAWEKPGPKLSKRRFDA